MRTGRVWLSWSPSQGAVHIEEVSQGLETNLRLFALNRLPDFVPIAEFDSREAANEFAEHVKRRRAQQERPSDLGGDTRWN